MIDSWLLEMFPGRTLEELDTMDWYRLQRALQAKHVRYIEEQRRQLVTGKIKGDKLDPVVGLEIKRHDMIAKHYGIE